MRMQIPRDAWDEIETAAAQHYAKVKDWKIGEGNYAPTETGIRVGLAGEWALAAWLDSQGISHEPDPAEWGWDRLTRRAAIEIKSRQIAHDRMWPWRVNAHTVEHTIPRRATDRPGKVILWAATFGSPDLRIHEVELLGWVTHAQMTQAVKVYEQVGNTGKSIWNYCADPDSIYRMEALAVALHHLDTPKAETA